MPGKRLKKLTPQQERDLDIELGFLECVVLRDPTYVDALLVLCDSYTRRGRFEGGWMALTNVSARPPATWPRTTTWLASHRSPGCLRPPRKPWTARWHSVN